MTNKLMIDVTVEDGKYRYTMTAAGTVVCYRHGEVWPERQAQGDGMLMALAAELQEAREELAAARSSAARHADDASRLRFPDTTGQ